MTHPPRLAHILDGRHGLLIATEYHKRCTATRARDSRRIAQRSKEDPAFRAMRRCRTRLRIALLAVKATKAHRRMIGCTVAELRTHLELQFAPGMSWANYGKWHIDHIKPCVRFDLRRASEQRACFQQRACFHFTNLQPLWAADNFAKGDHWEEPT